MARMASRTDALPTATVGARLDAPRRRPVRMAGAPVGLLAIAVVAGVAAGSVAIPPTQSFAVIVGHLIGVGSAVPETVDTIVWDLRVPRVLLAAVVGAGPAVAGGAVPGPPRQPPAGP